MCVCVWVCAQVTASAQGVQKRVMDRPPNAGVTGSRGLPDVGA